jgi:hypothetical protein
MRRKLRPVLDGDWWLIAPSPDLTGLVPGAREHEARWRAGEKRAEHNAPVDHHAFRGRDGKWHLWGCVRATVVGRVLYHWDADALTDTPWRDTRELIRCSTEAGECINDYGGQEWLQSPYFVAEDGTHYMFYGGHRSGAAVNGVDLDPTDPNRAFQICLMTSTDARTWTRHDDGGGHSRVFLGPGATRDPCLIKIDGVWHMYYVGFEGDGKQNHGFCLRTSKDLVNWSDWKCVHRDVSFGRIHTSCECPHVVYREGYFYLFRTVDYYRAETHVFRSDDPTDFGIGDARDKYVGPFPAAAPEIYAVGGQEYVSSNHNPPLGTQMCRLRWE